MPRHESRESRRLLQRAKSGQHRSGSKSGGDGASQWTPLDIVLIILAALLLGAAALFLGLWLTEKDKSCETVAAPTDNSSIEADFVCDPQPQVHALSQTLSHYILHAASLSGNASCLDYRANATLHASKTILVTQECLDLGTFRITTPGHFVFQHDIVFHPLPDNDFHPHANTTINTTNTTAYYPSPTYDLGFISAFTMESHHMMLDLNRFSLSQSITHRLLQRFYAHIELVNSPFIASQGPFQFTEEDDLVGAQHSIIRNGHLGLSSHHGIHGNGVQHILMEELTIQDYEVAGIALNDGTQVVVFNTHLLGTSQTVPVIATFTSARYIKLFVDRALTLANGSFPAKEEELLNASLHLTQLMEEVQEDIENGGLTVNETLHPEAYALFANPTGVLDGNSYGLLFHRKHAAVNGFQCQWIEPVEGQQLTIVDSSVSQVRAHVLEVLAVQNTTSEKFMVNPTGGLLRLETLMNQTTGEYEETALSRVELAIAHLVSCFNSTEQEQFGLLNIDAQVLDWAYNGSGSTNLTALIEQGAYIYRRNGDTQMHVNKGASGLRIDGILETCVSNFSVTNIFNSSPKPQTTPLLGETGPILYSGPNDLGHVVQTRHGANGANAVGIILSSVREARLNHVSVSAISSLFGTSRGIDVNNESEDVYLYEVLIQEILSVFYTIMDEITLSVGLHSNAPEEPNTLNVTIANVSTEALTFELLQARQEQPPLQCQGMVDLYSFL